MSHHDKSFIGCLYSGRGQQNDRAIHGRIEPAEGYDSFQHATTEDDQPG